MCLLIVHAYYCEMYLRQFLDVCFRALPVKTCHAQKVDDVWSQVLPSHCLPERCKENHW